MAFAILFRIIFSRHEEKKTVRYGRNTTGIDTGPILFCIISVSQYVLLHSVYIVGLVYSDVARLLYRIAEPVAHLHVYQ